jgi:hypothetical protein
MLDYMEMHFPSSRSPARFFGHDGNNKQQNVVKGTSGEALRLKRDPEVLDMCGLGPEMKHEALSPFNELSSEQMFGTVNRNSCLSNACQQIREFN